MQYVFTRPYRHYRAGEAVPASLPDGVVQTMLAHGRVREVQAKAIRTSRNKAVSRTQGDK